jgi:hypothetical protein
MKTARFAVWIVIAAAAASGALAGWASAAPDAGARAPRQAAPDAGGPPDGAVSLSLTPRDRGEGPSPLIFPAQTIPLRFDHAQHLKLGARCETCHTAAAFSTSAADNLVPGEAACRTCHEIDRTQPAKIVPPGAAAARCDACHVSEKGGGWMPPARTRLAEPPRVQLARPNLKFNHRLHAVRGIGCELCHANVAMGGLATRDDLPRMALCLGCHDGKQATSRCGACHLTEPDGRLKTALVSPATVTLGPAGARKLVPSGVLRGFDEHGPTFARDHRQAGKDEGYCLSCHKRSECIDCHGGTVRPFDIHPSDYVSLHGVDARRNTPDCSSCHRAQSFCIACHQRSGVAADPEGGLPGRQPRNPFGTGTQVKTFHPPGWAREEAGGPPSGHAQQARRNIRSCVSCHREESCLNCHSADPTRGATVSPHGPGFFGTSRCKALSSRNRRACLKCHELGSPQIDCEMP